MIENFKLQKRVYYLHTTADFCDDLWMISEEDRKINKKSYRFNKTDEDDYYMMSTSIMNDLTDFFKRQNSDH